MIGRGGRMKCPKCSADGLRQMIDLYVEAPADERNFSKAAIRGKEIAILGADHTSRDYYCEECGWNTLVTKPKLYKLNLEYQVMVEPFHWNDWDFEVCTKILVFWDQHQANRHLFKLEVEYNMEMLDIQDEADDLFYLWEKAQPTPTEMMKLRERCKGELGKYYYAQSAVPVKKVHAPDGTYVYDLRLVPTSVHIGEVARNDKGDI